MSDQLAELKARLMAVIDSYKQFNKELPAELKTAVNQTLGTQQTTPNKDGQTQPNKDGQTQQPAANQLPDQSAATADFIKKFGNVTPSAKAQGAKNPKQLEGLKSQMGNINAAATKHGINPALIAGMMSRETGGEEGAGYKSLKEFGITPKQQLDIMQGKLKAQGAEAHQIKQDEFVLLTTSPLAKFPGLNDTEKCWGDAKAQGYGPMQLDYGYNSSKILKVLMKSTPAERDTAAIDTCTGLLATYLKMMKKKYPQATEAEQLRAAMAAYNKGPNVDINNPDAGTAGGDYSKDVVERMAVLQGTDLFKGGANPNPQQQTNPEQPNQQTNPQQPAAKTISDSVGEKGKNNPADVTLVKTLLNNFGAGLDPANINCGPSTIAAIKKFQQEKAGLQNPDGLISPNGQTWKALNGQAPAGNNQTNPQQPVTPSKSITASVGEGGENKPEDVLLVKTLLNKFYNSFNLADANTNTKVGPTTIGVIKKFQQEKVGSANPDGRIDAGGKTWKVLNGETPAVTTGGNQQQPAGNGNGAKPGWLTKAESQKGISEKEAKNYEIINGYFKSCGLKFGDGGIESPTKTAWCAAFVSWCLKNSGNSALSSYDGVRAKSYADYGQSTKDGKPAYGAIAVCKTAYGHHVGIVVGRNGDSIVLLGGNQGDQVKNSGFPLNTFIGFRFPSNYTAPAEAYNLNGSEASDAGTTR